MLPHSVSGRCMLRMELRDAPFAAPRAGKGTARPRTRLPLAPATAQCPHHPAMALNQGGDQQQQRQQQQVHLPRPRPATNSCPPHPRRQTVPSDAPRSRQGQRRTPRQQRSSGRGARQRSAAGAGSTAFAAEPGVAAGGGETLHRRGLLQHTAAAAGAAAGAGAAL